MNTSEIDAEKRKSAFISIATRHGWLVNADGNWGVQLRRPKIFKELFLWLGALLLIFGIGALIWIWGFLDYMIRRDELLFIPSDSFLDDDFDSDIKKLI